MEKILLLAILICLYLSSMAGTVEASNTSAQVSYQLDWSDEFNGSSIDSSNWNFEVGGGGWGNNELEYYTDSNDNAHIEAGNLIIEARKEPYDGNDYTSARLTTQGKHEFQYGKIEARMKLPIGQGLWPAFWMLNTDGSTYGEIDIMEQVNLENNIYGSAHWGYHGRRSTTGSYDNIDVTEYQIYSVIWNESSIAWYIDNNKYYEVVLDKNSMSAFHEPFYIILNLAIGGSWPGNPDASTQFPARVYVDWIRVYCTARSF